MIHNAFIGIKTLNNRSYMIMEMHRNPSHDYNENITSDMKAWMRELEPACKHAWNDDDIPSIVDIEFATRRKNGLIPPFLKIFQL